jgi:hypothetical protein
LLERRKNMKLRRNQKYYRRSKQEKEQKTGIGEEN